MNTSRIKVSCYGGPRDGEVLTFLVSKSTPLPPALSLTKKKSKSTFIYVLSVDSKTSKYRYNYARTERT